MISSNSSAVRTTLQLGDLFGRRVQTIVTGEMRERQDFKLAV
jgi:hypothetical protein